MQLFSCSSSAQPRAAYAVAESYRPPQQLARIGHAELVEAGTFMVDHIRRSVPVVVTGVATSWPAMRRWSTAFLSSGELGDAEVHCDGLWGGRSLLINRTHLIKGRRRRMRMRAFVDRLRMQAARPGPTAMVGALEDPWALINAARDDELFWTLDGKNMSSHYPALLRDADPPNLLLFPPYARLYKLNLWASGYKFTPPHYDNSENLLLQVAGESELQLSEGCCCVLTAGSSYALERERGSVGMVLSCDPRGNRSLSR